MILTGRNIDRLEHAASEVGAKSTAAFDATDTDAWTFSVISTPIDHVLVTAGGPSYVPLMEMTAAQVRDALSDHVCSTSRYARRGIVFMGGPVAAASLGTLSPARPTTSTV